MGRWDEHSSGSFPGLGTVLLQILILTYAFWWLIMNCSGGQQNPDMELDLVSARYREVPFRVHEFISNFLFIPFHAGFPSSPQQLLGEPFPTGMPKADSPVMAQVMPGVL